MSQYSFDNFVYTGPVGGEIGQRPRMIIQGLGLRVWVCAGCEKVIRQGEMYVILGPTPLHRVYCIDDAAKLGYIRLRDPFLRTR